MSSLNECAPGTQDWPGYIAKASSNHAGYNGFYKTSQEECMKSSFDFSSIKAPASRTRRALRHGQRNWLRYLLGFLAVVAVLAAIFLPLLFLKIIPNAIQRIADESTLPVYNGTIIARDENTLSVSLVTALEIPSGFTVRTDDFDLQLYNKGSDSPEPKAFLSLTVPGQDLTGRAVISIEEQTATIQDRDELYTFLENMFQPANGSQVDVGIRGDVIVHLGPVSTLIHLDKMEDIAGLDGLSGLKVIASRLIIPAEADGTNLRGILAVPNKSPFDIGVGNMTFDLYLAANNNGGAATSQPGTDSNSSDPIGTVVLNDVTLAGSNMDVPFQGQISASQVVSSLGTGSVVAQQASSLLGQGSVHILARGNSTVAAGGTHLTYLENLLQGVTFNLDVDAALLMKDTLGNSQQHLVKQTLGNAENLVNDTLATATSLGNTPLASAASAVVNARLESTTPLMKDQLGLA